MENASDGRIPKRGVLGFRLYAFCLQMFLVCLGHPYVIHGKTQSPLVIESK